jgi:hypothetical protein
VLDIDVTTLFSPRPTTWVRLEGALVRPEEVHTLRHAIALLPIGMPTVVDLDGVSGVSELAATALCLVADDVVADRGRIVVVCSDGDARARLDRAQLAGRADLVATSDQARRLLSIAA